MLIMVATMHTPGPWEWDGNTLKPVDGNPHTSSVHSILDAEGGYGYVGSSLAATLAEQDNNRRLIAAAPDLLDALQAMVRQFTATPSTLHDSVARGKAHAAIAKATGSAA